MTVTDDGTKLRFVHSETAVRVRVRAGQADQGRPGPAGPAVVPKGDMDDRTRECMERMREERDRLEKEDDRKDDVKKDEEKKDDEKKDEEKKDDGKGRTRHGPQGRVPPRPVGGFGRGDYKAYSPDRKRYVFAQKHNLYLADEGKEAEAVQLTTDGEEDYSFSRRRSGSAASGRRTRGDQDPGRPTARPGRTSPGRRTRRLLRHPDRHPRGEGPVPGRLAANPRPQLDEVPVPDARRGDGPQERAVLLRRGGQEGHQGQVEVAVRAVRRTSTGTRPATSCGSSAGTGSQRHLEFCSLNTKTGEPKCLLAEGFDAAFLEFQPVRYVDESDEMIWWSERSGWGHFYLYGRDGKLKNADHQRGLAGQPDRRRRRQEPAALLHRQQQHT